MIAMFDESTEDEGSNGKEGMTLSGLFSNPTMRCEFCSAVYVEVS